MSSAQSPTQANALFEVLAANPPTIDEQAAVRNQFRAVQWLGDYNVRCSLQRAFEANGKVADEHLPPHFAEAIIDTHLSRFSQTLAIMHNGVCSSATLSELTQRFVDRPITKRGSVWERIPGDGFHIGQFVIYAAGGDIDIVEKPERERSFVAPTLLRLDNPDETFFISTDSRQRYRVKRASGSIAVTSEVLCSLNKDDPAFFGQLREDTQAYVGHLLEAAGAVGINPAAITDDNTSQFRFSFLREEVDPLMADPRRRGEISKDLLEQMSGRLTLMWENIRHQRFLDPTSGKAEDVGLSAAGSRVRSYFEALLMQVPMS